MQYQGLSSLEAAGKLARDGYNELPARQKRTWLKIALDVAREPMFLLLVACGLIYLFLGDVHEALILLGFVFVIMGITIFQENKTEKTLEALRDLSSPRALVLRDGQQKRIAGREVVREDIIILSDGDRVPADAYLLEANDLLADESLLTGESAAVRKKIWEGEDFNIQPGGEDLPLIFSGTMVVRGQGIAKVLSTAGFTRLGKIGKSIEKLQTEETPLQKQTLSLVKKFALVSAVISVLVTGLYWLRYGRLVQGVLAGLTLAMSILPEEIPVILMIFLSLGAWRISRRNVLTRRVPAVETLGATTVLCVDKTGTLTLNQMNVQNLFSENKFIEINEENLKNLPAGFQELVSYSVLASEPVPLDPMDKAFHQLGREAIGDFKNFYDSFELIKEYALTRKLLATTHMWKAKNQERYLVAAKGAPEAIFELCHLAAGQQKQLHEKVEIMASRGQRVLAAARGIFEGERIPESHHDYHFEFLGLMGVADPPRPGVEKSINECREAGLRVVMITGDYPVTARAIGHQIGLAHPERYLSGQDLEKMSDEELREKVKDTNIFARVIPEQKLRLVEALKAGGAVVAMTGDGVNDAPALKAAHIGIAMGERGTDVAREAASLVLLDDAFSSIVAAVRLGRRIFDNIKKAIAYTFAVHVPIAGLAFFPLVFKWPMVFWPVHIVFLELIIDPACSFVFEMEPDESGVMKRPPRNPGEPLFSRPAIVLSVAQGLAVLIVLTILYGLALKFGLGELKARALVFSGLILTNLGLIVNNSSWERGFFRSLKIINISFWWLAAGATGFLALALYSPLNRIFRIAPLGFTDIQVVLAFAAGGLLAAEACKHLKIK